MIVQERKDYKVAESCGGSYNFVSPTDRIITNNDFLYMLF